MADVQVLVFRSTGALLAEIEPDLTSAKWALNRPGKAEFSMPYSDSKCTRDILRPGNWLLLRFACGLPDWGGVIEFPRRRTRNGVGVTAWSGERLLDWRVSGKDMHFEGMAPGAVFQYAIELENAEHATGIDVGNIYAGGTVQTMRYHYYDLLRRAQELARLTGEDFAVLPRLLGGQLSFLAHWYGQRGRDLSGSVLLAEDKNVVDATLDEQGPVANRVIFIGDGVEWDDNRPVAIVEDAESIEQYGYREYSEFRAGTTVTGMLEANAAAVLETKKQPAKMFSLTVTDEEPGRFASYGIGDIVHATLFVRGGDEWGYDDPVRVIARQWAPDHTCILEVAEAR